MWATRRNITLCAEHIPGVDNVGADQESRKQMGLAEWMLNKAIFNKIHRRWGPLQVDLFAARHNYQLQRYFSYGPDPGAEVVDALAQSWKGLRVYAFTPFNLLGRCLKKIKQERVQSAILIAPVWRGQPWYPAMLESIVDLPILLPNFHRMLVNPTGQVHPLLRSNSLRLASWRVSGDPYRTKEFLTKHSKSCAHRGEKVIFLSMEKMVGLVS